jgi:ABC-type branched-subunit amino acid transport system ATPase component
MSALLEIKDLWGGYTEGVDIIRGINMEVQQGETVGIIGLNGSGKSTFSKAIMNMIPYRRGHIFFNGEDVTGLRTDQLTHRGIAIMQQGGRVFPNLSVWDNLQLACNNSQLLPLVPRFSEVIPILHRPKRELQNTMADKLSGGQRHQLALAMTLATAPQLVIFDEPTAGLSPRAVEETYVILHSCHVRHGITFLLIEQNIAKAVEFCDIACILKQGTFDSIVLDKDIDDINKIIFINH